MNAVNLIGRITKDPELRTSSGGKNYCAFTIAVNEFSGGEKFTQFVPCFAWEKVAENMAKFVKKGGQLAVEGQINVRQENNDGKMSSIITIRASRVEYLANEQKTNNQNQKVQDSEGDAILWDD